MGTKTEIAWTDSTWNPVSGCDRVSPGCDHCYAESIATRFAGSKAFPEGFAVTEHRGRLDDPFRWRKPRRVFVCSMADLFHPAVPDELIAEVFARMMIAGQHTFQVLTKRPQRMQKLLSSDDWWHALFHARMRRAVSQDVQRMWARTGVGSADYSVMRRPAPNIWLGVSVENQRYADLRIPLLINTPAAVRFVSAEPLLGPVDLIPWLYRIGDVARDFMRYTASCERVDWVICGGESGPGARPMHPSWARGVRDQCSRAQVPFFFKQWGAWAMKGYTGREQALLIDGHLMEHGARLGMDHMMQPVMLTRVGAGAAGHELDGVTHQEWPG